jgi:DNA replication protein DnaC
MQRLPSEPTANVCPDCGLAVYPRQVTVGGQVRYVPRRCPCQEGKEKQRRTDEQRAVLLEAQSRNTYSWLGSAWSDIALREKTFANFDASRQAVAYEAAQLFVEDLEGVLILDGAYGTGKTHILAAICNELLNKYGKGSLFVTSPKLFAAIGQRISENADYQTLIKRAVNTRLLCLDDIDKAKPSDFREEIYFAIIDERSKAGRPIAISTNRLADLAIFIGGAAASRLKAGQVAIKMAGSDYREEL